MNKYIFILLVSLVFDVKGEEDGGGALQYISFVSCLFACFVLIAKLDAFSYGNLFTSRFGPSLIWMIAGSSVSAFVYDVEFGNYIRILIPYLFLFVGYAIGRKLYHSTDSVFQIMIVCSFFGSLATFLYAMFAQGISLQDARWQILNPILFIGVPIAVGSVLQGRRYRLFNSMTILFAVSLVLISATRSWMIAFFLVISIGYIIADIERTGRTILISLLKVAVGLIAVGLFFVSIFSDEVGRMIERSIVGSEQGIDITTATRLAEIDFQLSSWTETFLSTLIGKGLGSYYGFGGELMRYILSVLGESGRVDDWWFAGHSFWVYSFYALGLLFGWVVPVMLVVYFGKSLIAIRRRMLFGFPLENQLTFFLIFMSILLSTIGANFMGGRQLALYLGIILGMFEVLGGRPKNV